MIAPGAVASMQRLAGGGGAPSQPTVGTVLARWKASDAASVGDGNGIATVPDASGNGKTVSCFGPTYHADGGYGDPVIRFAGADAALFPDIPFPVGGLTVLHVLRRTAVSPTGSHHLLVGGVANSFGGYISHSTDRVGIIKVGVAFHGEGTTALGTTPHAIGYTYDGTNLRITVDGVVELNTPLVETFGGVARLGYLYNDSNYSQVDYTDTLVFGPALTTSEEASWNAYLQSIYNSI